MQIKEIMTHTTFVIFYIVLNIIYLYILGSAGKDIKQAIQLRDKQWFIIIAVR